MKRVLYAELLLAVAVLLFLVPLCSKKWNGWERDYYSYQIGAYINGVEHHEKADYHIMEIPGLFFERTDCGFYLCGCDSIVRINSFTSSSYEWWSSPDHHQYGMFIEVFVDSASFKPGASFVFDTTSVSNYNGDLYRDWENLKESDGLPFVIGTMSKGNVIYTIVDGEITFGSFTKDSEEEYRGHHYYYGSNKDRVTFNFIAENSDGQILIIEDGYLNNIKYRVKKK